MGGEEWPPPVATLPTWEAPEVGILVSSQGRSGMDGLCWDGWAVPCRQHDGGVLPCQPHLQAEEGARQGQLLPQITQRVKAAPSPGRRPACCWPAKQG